MKILHTVHELSQYFYDLLLFEGFETVFKLEQGILSILHYEIYVALVVLDVIQFDQVYVRDRR